MAECFFREMSDYRFIISTLYIYIYETFLMYWLPSYDMKKVVTVDVDVYNSHNAKTLGK